LGYAPGVVHRLDDGSEREQVGIVKEYVYRERPACRIIWDRERHWIDVDGASGFPRCRGMLDVGKRDQGAYRPS
jgi:hypothetical protein